MAKKTTTEPAPAPHKVLGASIDALFKLREKKRKAEAAVKAIDEQITIESDAMIAKLREAKLESASGKLATASINTLTFPNVKDWPTVHAWVKKTGSFELLHKRISVETWREWLDAGKPIPGIEAASDTKLGLRKR